MIPDFWRGDFWRGRRVLLTGQTGFKGAWASVMLADLGADVTAFALEPQTDPNLWQSVGRDVAIESIHADLRDASDVARICSAAEPEIVLHMAAQAQVRESYRDPVGTFASNILGTVNLLQALRASVKLRAVLVVTSDKVYANPEAGTAFAENAPLGGSDPYSASKGATEIAVRSYAESFFSPAGVPLATARGGNVIGGGDFSSDRLVPDLYRAARNGVAVELRYPAATRPWQHVLDCLAGYFTYAEYLAARGVAVGRLTLEFHSRSPAPDRRYFLAALEHHLDPVTDRTPPDTALVRPLIKDFESLFVHIQCGLSVPKVTGTPGNSLRLSRKKPRQFCFDSDSNTQAGFSH